MSPAERSIHAQFTASIPENYDRYLGPVIFDPYARDLAGRLPNEAGRILETACGTGIVTKRLLEALPGGSSIVATDLNAAMLDHAHASIGEDRRLTWQVADMGALTYPDGSFDAYVCQFGLMFAPDKDAALREARRVLASGGSLLLSVWDRIDRNSFAAIAHEVISEFFPADPPTFYQIPFSLHERAAMRGMFEAAGFVNVRDKVLRFESTAASAEGFARGLVEGNPVSLEIQNRGGSLEEVGQALAERLRARLGDHPVSVPIQAIVFEATAGPA